MVALKALNKCYKKRAHRLLDSNKLLAFVVGGRAL